MPEFAVRSAPYRLPQALIVTEAKSVTIDVVVRDRRGRAIRGLTRDSFLVLDNGKPEALTFFKARTQGARAGAAEGAQLFGSAAPAVPVEGVPRYVALLFDDVNSSRNDLAEARNAAVRFVHEAFGPGDRAAVFTISGTQSLGFTRDHNALATAIARIALHPRSSNQGISACPH
ncbi:MAG: VWA domain-containing protein, partial [Terriglobales bacterium]